MDRILAHLRQSDLPLRASWRTLFCPVTCMSVTTLFKAPTMRCILIIPQSLLELHLPVDRIFQPRIPAILQAALGKLNMGRSTLVLWPRMQSLHQSTHKQMAQLCRNLKEQSGDSGEFNADTQDARKPIEGYTKRDAMLGSMMLNLQELYVELLVICTPWCPATSPSYAKITFLYTRQTTWHGTWGCF
jgi:hypothetical protein